MATFRHSQTAGITFKIEEVDFYYFKRQVFNYSILFSMNWLAMIVSPLNFWTMYNVFSILLLTSLSNYENLWEFSAKNYLNWIYISPLNLSNLCILLFWSINLSILSSTIFNISWFIPALLLSLFFIVASNFFYAFSLLVYILFSNTIDTYLISVPIFFTYF